MKKPNKEETLKKWDSVLSGMGMSEEKKEWMSHNMLNYIPQMK
jgi:hypothetical protein